MLKYLIFWAAMAINVYLVYAGNTHVCGDGLEHREAVCAVLDGYNYCTHSDDYGHFCINVQRPLRAGETFLVESSWSGKTMVTVLYAVRLPFVVRSE